MTTRKLSNPGRTENSLTARGLLGLNDQIQRNQKQLVAGSETKQLILYLDEEEFSRLQSLSDFVSIPLPMLCRALLRQVVYLQPAGGLESLGFQLISKPSLASLSDREVDILNLMTQSLTNREIASSLKISEQTVKNHVTSILKKMKANNRTQAALLALKHNLQDKTPAVDSSTPEISREQYRVLILEGTSASSEELACCLTEAGLTVARMPNCPETLMAMNSLKPDVVIVDGSVANSFEVCHQIRDVTGIPVLIAGEDLSADIWQKALIEAGADLYLRKPFDGEVLAAQIRAILSRYRKKQD